jgi:hypothetical protein
VVVQVVCRCKGPRCEQRVDPREAWSSIVKKSGWGRRKRLRRLEIELLSLHFTSLHGLTRAPNLDRARSPQKTLIEKTPGRIHLQYTRTPTSQQNTNSRHRSVTRKNTERRIPQKIDAQAAHTEGNPGRKLQLDLKDVGREKTCLLRELTVGEARKARSERKRACNDQWLEQ